MFSPEVINMIILGIGQTLYMVILSTLFGYVLGLPWGITLAVTNKEGIRPNAAVYRVIDFITNIMRSIPFLILLILIIPLTKLIVGKSYGSTATIVPLVISAIFYLVYLLLSSLKPNLSFAVLTKCNSSGPIRVQRENRLEQLFSCRIVAA